MRAGNLRVVPSGATRRTCPERGCSGVLEPTTMNGVSRCSNWPRCNYMGGLVEMRRDRKRCTHRATRMVVRMERYTPLEVIHVCDACGADVPVPPDVILDYRGGFVRVLRTGP